MKTYFIRHGGNLDIDRPTYMKLIEEGRVGFHHPKDKHGWDPIHDARSTDPQDYEGRARTDMVRLQEIGTRGGYVCAAYAVKNGCVLGIVEPGTEIEPFEGRWGSKNNHGGRTAVLKTLRLQRVRHLSAAESVGLLAARPRRGIISTWPKGTPRVRQLVEWLPWDPEVSDLNPSQQEMLVNEALRLRAVEDHGIPRLESLALPVGRTLKAIDLYGVTPDGERLLVQVTNHSPHSKAGRTKLERLRTYADQHVRLVFCCNTNEVGEADGVVLVPLRLLFDLYTETTVGERWLAAGGIVGA